MLRERNKMKFKRYLFNILNSKYYQQQWNKFLKGYTIDIIQAKHRLEAINILSYAFSASSGSILSRIFQISTKQSFIIYAPIIDHLIKTGTGFVILDPNGYVCTVYYLLDAVENRLIKYDKSIKWSDLELKLLEMNTRLRRIYQYPKQNEIKYGEYVDGAVSAMRPDLMGKGFQKMFEVGIAVLCSMGYKKSFAIQIHPKTINMAHEQKKMIGTYVYQQNLGEFMLGDGSTVNDILNDIKQKYDWKNVDKFRNIKVTIGVNDYEEIRRYYNLSPDEIGIFYWKKQYDNHMQIRSKRKKSKL